MVRAYKCASCPSKELYAAYTNSVGKVVFLCETCSMNAYNTISSKQERNLFKLEEWEMLE